MRGRLYLHSTNSTCSGGRHQRACPWRRQAACVGRRWHCHSCSFKCSACRSGHRQPTAAAAASGNQRRAPAQPATMAANACAEAGGRQSSHLQGQQGWLLGAAVGRHVTEAS
eukprot:352821-Chlamydomonas_euryale.AAC.16